MASRSVLAIILVVAFLTFAPFASTSEQSAGVVFGAGDACADGSCRPMSGWICNIGGDDHFDWCRSASGEVCF